MLYWIRVSKAPFQICASGGEDIVFCAYCQYMKKQRAFDTLTDTVKKDEEG